MIRDNLLNMGERTCPVCGKTFWAGEQWQYKKGFAKAPRIYCSWKCMRSEEKANMTVSDKIEQAVRDGLTDAEIRKVLGVSQKQIDYCYRRYSTQGKHPDKKGDCYERKTGGEVGGAEVNGG